MKNWYKLRYHLSNGAPGITNVNINIEALGDNLEDAISTARINLAKLLRLTDAEQEIYLALVDVDTRR